MGPFGCFGVAASVDVKKPESSFGVNIHLVRIIRVVPFVRSILVCYGVAVAGPRSAFPFLISSPLSMMMPTIETCMIVTIFIRIFSYRGSEGERGRRRVRKIRVQWNTWFSTLCSKPHVHMNRYIRTRTRPASVSCACCAARSPAVR